MRSIVAIIKVKPGMEANFEAVAKDLAAKVNASEPNCKLYTLSRRDDALSTYIFMERYVDQAAVDFHRQTEHYKTLGRKMSEYFDGRPEVMLMTEV